MRSVTIKTLLRNEITSDPRPGGSCRQALAVGLWVGPFCAGAFVLEGARGPV